MQCPKDKTAMRTIPVQDSTFDVCDACGGVWFDEEELRKTAQTFAWGIPAQVEEFAPILKENDVSATESPNDPPYGEGVICPNDGMKTLRYIYAGDSHIILDRCIKCHGTWFDGDELIRMAGYLKPSARDLMGKFMIEEMKATEKLNEQIAQLPLLPLKIVGKFYTPAYLVASILSFTVKHAGYDLGFDSKLYKHRK
jgi:Zn-finger nucleic acid-binding protein